MRPSRVIALAAFFLLVPGGIVGAYAGAGAGLYPSTAIPLVFGVGFAIAISALFVLLPVVSDRFD